MPPRGRGRGRGKGKGRQSSKSPSPSPQPSPRSPTPPPESESEHEEHQDESLERAHEKEKQTEKSSKDSENPKKKAKKAKIKTDLTDEEEAEVVEWLRENEFIYNKKKKAYKDTHKKISRWQELAEKMGKDVEMLMVWYNSLRTRYGRLLKTKSGQGVAERTERDEWIMQNFNFLQNHIYQSQSRSINPVKKAACSARPATIDDVEDGGFEDDEMDVTSEVSNNPSQDTPTPTVLLDVRPKRTSAKKCKEEEDKLLAALQKDKEKSINIQEKLLDLLKNPEQQTERTSYADWSRSVMVDLHPTIWRQFQEEHTALLQRYLRKNDVAKQSAQPQVQQQHRVSVQQQQQHYQLPSTSQQQQQYQYPSQHYQSSQWQPQPNQWPRNVEGGISVWDSQSAEWVQKQMQPQTSTYTTLQTVTTATTQSPTPTPTTMTSTPAQENSFLSSIPSVASGDPLSTSFLLGEEEGNK